MTIRRGTTSIAGRSAVALAGAAALLVVATACSTDTTNTGSSSTTTVAPTPTVTAPPAGAAITDAQKQQLCTDLEAQLSNWRVQGPTLGRGGLNILVQTWAAQSGVINLQVVQDRAIIDDITTETCSDVRDEAIRSLDIPDLASGLVGF
ncbi:hypothetical protein O4160_03615 [Rhodococcus sp. IEGM 1401]|jgi:hypothetical protein|uniref:hypothetical protein n=1 Tax=unclassified Rhodococcus (in: high G+C Gram-positive bacteria) TaxID=192944 RepID=UPI00159505EB|nr:MULTISPECIES: hypothetical protein [unclassified Rhodococcus (in: high G+C Gram-positive bacteria)]MCZ4559919.1 hypothetical protein [Rhodococcus sp. IEGM 1401]MDI9920037.1 hypothetical protein [Rhodococcus sp. IEGM 1372]MDI9926402.1 hypothetical protein [Rhodococcus sp. IEGM 1341]MDV8032500.1 hypothetical protein [Rhodococcus sp. IEGM 1414]